MPGSMQPVMLFMKDRTKLIIVNLAVILLPYRLDFPVALLFVTAILCTAIDVVLESWAKREHLSRNFMAAISLYRRLKYHPS